MHFRDLQSQYAALKDDTNTAIQQVLESGNYISGPEVKELERQLAEYVGSRHCIACGNGTDALTIALMAWDVGEGDAVFIPDFTFFASGEAPVFLGATPVFVDVDSRTFNLDAIKLEEAILAIKVAGQLVPKAVVAVDLFGLPADYREIRAVCQRYGLLLLEDGAQGFGGSVDEKMACSFGDISTTSFFPAKPLGCYGDGGAIFTDDDHWAELMRSYAVHGKGSMKYDNVRIGMNSRLDTLQAAILQVKLKAFVEYEIDDINEIAVRYSDNLRDANILLPIVPKGFRSSWAQYTVQLPQGSDRLRIQAALMNDDIPTMVYYPKPMREQKAFDSRQAAIVETPITLRLCETVLSLPMHPYMNDDQVDFICKKFLKALS